MKSGPEQLYRDRVIVVELHAWPVDGSVPSSGATSAELTDVATGGKVAGELSGYLGGALPSFRPREPPAPDMEYRLAVVTHTEPRPDVDDASRIGGQAPNSSAASAASFGLRAARACTWVRSASS